MKNPSVTQVSQDEAGGYRYAVPLPTVAVVAHASTATLTNTIADKNHNNTGAGGAIVLTLPRADSMAYKGFRTYVSAAQAITFTPVSTEKVWLAGNGVVAKYLLLAGTIGNYVDLFSDGTGWHVVNWSGVLTKEA